MDILAGSIPTVASIMSEGLNPLLILHRIENGQDQT